MQLPAVMLTRLSAKLHPIVMSYLVFLIAAGRRRFDPRNMSQAASGGPVS
jgi:hypothetical protein